MASIDSFSLSDRFFSCLPGITDCLSLNRNSNSNSNSNHNISNNTPELEGLLSNSNDDYDDSDAISLLSNIADSDSSRRNRRRRNRLRRGGGGVTAQLLACGLFGRSKGQIQSREVTIGNRNGNQNNRIRGESSDGEDSDRVTSLRDVDSGEEDAGMLRDDAIATFANRQEQDDDDQLDSRSQSSTTSKSKKRSKSKKKSKEEEEEEEEVKRKQEEEGAHKKALEEDERLAMEEQRLAQQEEASIAKARRKAERRAAKAGLLKFQNDGLERKSSKGEWRTEAEAEAAAGGFGFAQEVENDGENDYHQNGERFDDYGDYNYNNGQEGEEGFHSGYEEGNLHQFNSSNYDQQEQIIHHHHHYYNPSSQEEGTDPSHNLLSPNGFSLLPALPSPTSAEEETLVENNPTQDDDDEDEEGADIAGLSFGKKKRNHKRNESQSGGSGSKGNSSNGNARFLTSKESASNEYRRRGESFNSGSNNGSGNGSGNGNDRLSRGLPTYSSSNQREPSPNNIHSNFFPNERTSSSSSSNSSSSRANYRDKPRRHQRNESKGSSRDGLNKNRIDIPTSNNHQSSSPSSSSNNNEIFSPDQIQESTNSSNSNVNAFNNSPTQIYSPILSASYQQQPEDSIESNNHNVRIPNSYISKSRKGSRTGESSSNGSSSAAANRRARGIPPINEESPATSTSNTASTTSPIKSQNLNSQSGIGNGGSFGGLNSSRNPNGANAWSKYNQGNSGKRLEEEEVDGL